MQTGKICIFRYLIIVFISIIYYSKSFSETTQMIYENFSDEDGLISNKVKTVYQDSWGYMWFGTVNGLSRFDGYEFVNFEYNPEDTSSLIGKEIQHIGEDSNGYLWVATNGGLNMYDHSLKQFIRYTNDHNNSYSLSANHVNSFVNDSLNNLWVCTTKGLQYFNRQEHKFYSFPPDSFSGYSIKDKEIINIWFDRKDEILWVLPANEEGILGIELEKATVKFISIPGFEKNKSKKLYQTKEGEVFFLQMDGSLFEFKDGGIIQNILTPHDYPNPVDEMIFQTLEKINDKVWIGGNEALYIYDMETGEFDILTHEKGRDNWISSSNIYDIYLDQFNSIWLATFEAGVDVWHRDKQKFKSLNYQKEDTNSISAGAILSIDEADDGIIWIASDGYGLSSFNPRNGRITNFKYDPEHPDNSLSNNSVIAVQESNGMIFTGHWRGGMTKFDPDKNSYQVYKYNAGKSNNLPSNSVWHIHEASDGMLLLATMQDSGGVSFFDPQTESFNNYLFDPENPTSISDKYCYYVYEDRQGIIWVGTAGHGLNRFNRDTESFTHFLPEKNNPFSLSQKSVLTIFEDSENRFWVGTYAGLNLMDREKGTFKKFFKKDGLADNAIKHILEDKNGILWITTAKGLSRFNPQTEVFENYSMADGLLNKEFIESSGCVTSNGYIYLGGRNGVNYFHPDSMKRSNIPPKIVFTGLKIFNQPLEIGDSINGRVVLKKPILVSDTLTLTHKEDFFSISFTALHYLAPMRIKYKYKLEGYNNRWIETNANHRFATFTNLEPGEYNFRVIASNNDGVWNSEGISKIIIITPPWWKTWFFRIIITAFLIVSFIALYNLRIHSLKSRQYELEKSVNDRTKKLKEINAELLAQKEEILQHKSAISEQNSELTLQKKMLEEAADEVKTAAQTKIRFFMNVSHEFRTPLTLILGPLEAVMKKTKDPFFKNQHLIMHRNTKRLLRLVNQLLDLRKLETGTMKLHASEDDIVSFLKRIYESFQYLARRHRIKYEFITGLDEWNTWFDHDIMEKIIYNLLSNSFKFTPDGHSISLFVEKDFLQEGDSLIHYLKDKEQVPFEQQVIVIRVKDTGTGIDPESIDKIFERFFTFQVKTIRKKSGTGIGLALTKELVEIHHGIIYVEESSDQGAEFVVKLLLGKEFLDSSQIGQQKETIELDKYPHITNKIDFSDKPVQIEDQQANKAGKVLVVDDNPDIRLYIRQNLDMDFQILEAWNGEQGLEKALTEIPDLIISDVMMPLMDGIEFTRQVKVNELSSHIPVILLTAKASEENQLKGLETGADDYIMKPFNTEVLKAKVKNFIEIRRKLRDLFSKNPFVRAEEFTSNKVDKSFVDKLENIIAENMANVSFGPEDLAREMALSRTLLYMKMKALTGVTVNDYIKTVRLKKAARIILKEAIPIHEVAIRVGFKNPKHFSTAFSHYFGQPPSQYGKNQNN